MPDSPQNSTDHQPNQADSAAIQSSEEVLGAILELLDRQVSWERKQDAFAARQNDLLNQFSTHPQKDIEPESELAELLQKTRLQRKAIAAEFRIERAKLQQAWAEFNEARHCGNVDTSIDASSQTAQQVSIEVEELETRVTQQIEERSAQIQSEFQDRIESLQSALNHAHRQQSRAEDLLQQLTQRCREIEEKIDYLESENQQLTQSNAELTLGLQQINVNGPATEASETTEADAWEAQKKALLVQYGDHSALDETNNAPTAKTIDVETEAPAESTNKTKDVQGQSTDDEHIAQMREEWAEKVRAAEIELSIERANVARQRNALEEKIAHFERERIALEKAKQPEPSQPKWSLFGWLFGNESRRKKKTERNAKNRRQELARIAKSPSSKEVTDNEVEPTAPSTIVDSESKPVEQQMHKSQDDASPDATRPEPDSNETVNPTSDTEHPADVGEMIEDQQATKRKRRGKRKRK